MSNLFRHSWRIVQQGEFSLRQRPGNPFRGSHYVDSCRSSLLLLLPTVHPAFNAHDALLRRLLEARAFFSQLRR